MFGLSFAEMIVILLVALICVRPKDIPRLFSKLGRMYGKLNRQLGEAKRMMSEAEEIDDADR
jgi:sec-independent protein translocase protein TatB